MEVSASIPPFDVSTHAFAEISEFGHCPHQFPKMIARPPPKPVTCSKYSILAAKTKHGFN
jgi:hypothetical protein